MLPGLQKVVVQGGNKVSFPRFRAFFLSSLWADTEEGMEELPSHIVVRRHSERPEVEEEMGNLW